MKNLAQRFFVLPLNYQPDGEPLVHLTNSRHITETVSYRRENYDNLFRNEILSSARKL